MGKRRRLPLRQAGPGRAGPGDGVAGAERAGAGRVPPAPGVSRDRGADGADGHRHQPPGAPGGPTRCAEPVTGPLTPAAASPAPRPGCCSRPLGCLSPAGRGPGGSAEAAGPDVEARPRAAGASLLRCRRAGPGRGGRGELGRCAGAARGGGGWQRPSWGRAEPGMCDHLLLGRSCWESLFLQWARVHPNGTGIWLLGAWGLFWPRSLRLLVACSRFSDLERLFCSLRHPPAPVSLVHCCAPAMPC